jgi:hypothetical protein
VLRADYLLVGHTNSGEKAKHDFRQDLHKNKSSRCVRGKGENKEGSSESRVLNIES